MAKIPKQAKKVFSGVIFDVYQWPQKMFDGSTETFEALRRSDTAIVIGITPKGQILVVEDEQPQRSKVLTFPGGRVNAGEEALAGAKRELHEETGYTSDSWELWYSYSASEKIDSTVYYYLARDIRKTGEPHPDPGEKIAVRLVSVDQMLADIVSGKHNAFSLGMHIMRQLLQGKRDELVDFLNNRKK